MKTIKEKQGKSPNHQLVTNSQPRSASSILKSRAMFSFRTCFSYKVDAMKIELDRLPTKPTDYSENQRVAKMYSGRIHPTAYDLIGLPAMTQFLETLFGDELICTSCVYALSRPGHSRNCDPYDAQPLRFKDFRHARERATLVRVLYYLDDYAPSAPR